MYHNRFRHLAAPAPAPSLAAFVVCPASCLPPLPADYQRWQQALYQWAFAEAQAVLRPSLPERDLLAVWN